MIIQTANYTDFLTIVKDLNRRQSVFYLTFPSFFVIYAIENNRDIAVLSGNLVTQPVTFNSDFPGAIQITNTLGFP